MNLQITKLDIDEEVFFVQFGTGFSIFKATEQMYEFAKSLDLLDYEVKNSQDPTDNTTEVYSFEEFASHHDYIDYEQIIAFYQSQSN